MRFLVMGAGAIGAWIGANLVMARQPVTFVGRPAFVEAACTHGVHVSLPSKETWRLHDLKATDNLAAALNDAPFDAVLLCMKAYALDQALAELKAHADLLSDARLITFQNGVGSEEKAASVFGAHRVIAATLTSPVSLDGPAAIRLERAGGGIGLALLVPPRAQGGQEGVDVTSAFSSTPLLNVRTYADYRAMKWSKLLLNIMGNATSALLGLPVADIYNDPKLFAVEMRMLRESLAVMRAHEPPITVVNLPGQPARALARAVMLLPDVLLRPILSRRVAKGRGDKRPSLYYDVANRTGKSEVTVLNGAVVEAGRRLGVATPVNEALTQMMLETVSGASPLSPAQARAALVQQV